ncbi:class B sortase [Paenibacillus periandrae]|uniref:class B sortase n=1 Tax=Paenibacillus periandrae TaxID=1761741 RepID=UPI001F09A4DA|nr:class B sortase [Paenibacillus periandrae]
MKIIEPVASAAQPDPLDETSAPAAQPSPFLKVDFTDLKKRNSDIIAWLKIGSVNFDMPIVQTTNNDFYLDHDLDKKPNSLGWVFADPRSNTEHLNFNTVLYGHNALSGVMFGSLKGLFDHTEEEKPDSPVIQFSTPSRQMLFEVVSVYVIDETDLLYTKQVFAADADRQQFIDRLLERNEVKSFNRSDLSTFDKFLTLSTCYGSAGTTKRLVVVAKQVALNG